MARDLDIIQTERLILRGINETDAIKIVEWRSDPEVYRFFKSPHKITVREHVAWYNNSYLPNENRFDWMCIEQSSGKRIGVFGLVRDEDLCEVNYLLASEAQHKGFAAPAVFPVHKLPEQLPLHVFHLHPPPSVSMYHTFRTLILHNCHLFVRKTGI